MSRATVDLRSDTVTRPSPGMRRAMAEAVVDDDVLGKDPTVDQLERRVAKLLGKESALFFPSGTQANQAAVLLHTRPGSEAVCEAESHLTSSPMWPGWPASSCIRCHPTVATWWRAMWHGPFGRETATIRSRPWCASRTRTTCTAERSFRSL